VISFKVAFVKSAKISHASPDMIQKDSDLSVRRQCELLKINRSRLYYQAVPADETHLAAEEELMRWIDDWHTKFPYFGSRKIAVKLCGEGYNVGRKTVRRLMQTMGIYAIYPKINLSKRNFRESVVPYLLRDYPVTFPNQVWSIDITYISMPKGHMYLTAIIDWYSRKIVGHYLSDTLDTDSVIHAVKEAVETHGIPAILNSDQGCQFTSNEYKSLLKKLHIRQSMDGKSRWADNIMIERWFRSLKTEQIYPNEYHSPRKLRKLINEYVNAYNRERPHEALGYKVPDAVYYDSFAA
jgi:putative transposase